MVGARTTVFGAAFVAIVSRAIGTTLAITTAWLRGEVRRVRVRRESTCSSRSPASCWRSWRPLCSGRACSRPALALAIAYSPYVARVLRGAALKERAMAYIAALEVQGFGAWRLCVRAPAPQHQQPHRRAGHDPVRLRHGRPGRDLVPRPRRAAAPGRLGRHGLRGQDRASCRATRSCRCPPCCASCVVVGRQLPRRPARRLLEGRAPMSSACSRSPDLTCRPEDGLGPREVHHRHVAVRSPRARRWAWSASPARASR